MLVPVRLGFRDLSADCRRERCLTPSVSSRCTPLRDAAARDLADSTALMAAVLRFVPRPEAGGDRPGATPPKNLRFVRAWHEGPATRYASRSKYSLRGWARGLAHISRTQEMLCVIPPHCRHPLSQDPRQWVPAASRRPRLTIRRPG